MRFLLVRISFFLVLVIDHYVRLTTLNVFKALQTPDSRVPKIGVWVFPAMKARVAAVCVCVEYAGTLLFLVRRFFSLISVDVGDS